MSDEERRRPRRKAEEVRAKPPQANAPEPEFWADISRLPLGGTEQTLGEIGGLEFAKLVATMRPERLAGLTAVMRLAGLRAQRELWHQNERGLSLQARTLKVLEDLREITADVYEEVEACADEFLPPAQPAAEDPPETPHPAPEPSPKPTRKEGKKAKTPATVVPPGEVEVLTNGKGP